VLLYGILSVREFILNPKYTGKMIIKPFEHEHLSDIVRLSIEAWNPVFESLKHQLKEDIYHELYPNGWEASQKEAVVAVCTSSEYRVWVACYQDQIAGFIAFRVIAANKLGEIFMIAVSPDYQRKGIATQLTNFAIDWMKKSGITVVMVETGSDRGHYPARKVYEKLGFNAIPISRYYNKI
jgi:ribosomal protein S18 acetylase RimI-like enzyme